VVTQTPIVQRQVPAPVPAPQLLNLQPTIQRVSYPSMVTAISSQPHPQDNRFQPDQHVPTTGMSAISNSVGNAAATTNFQNSSTCIAPTALPKNRYATVSRIPQPSSTNVASIELPLTRPGPNTTVALGSPHNCQDTIMTYSQFYDFLKRILQNEQEYRQSMNKVYVVGPMQQVGPKMYFNIEKASKRHKPWHDLNTTSPNVPLSAGSDNKVWSN
jgi:hypothetical protein